MATDTQSLQDLIDQNPDLVEFFRNRSASTHSRKNPGLSPVPWEVSSWRDEQIAWREAAILFDLSHHMPEMYISGPDALALLSRVGVNTLGNLRPGIAKQFVAVNSRGQIIGECVLHDHGGTYELMSGQPLQNWIEYQAQAGGYDVTIAKDPATWDNPKGRTKFRYQLDGPAGWDIFEKVIEGEAPEMKFFHTAPVRIAGVDVLVHRHGMAGHRGVEISGPYAEGERIRALLLEAGEPLGLRAAGSRAYHTASVESGWIGYPLPGIYTGDEEREYRKWLPATSWEGRFQLGGSYVPASLEDLYLTPSDLGYDRIVKFDHDFIGREALEAAPEVGLRKKVALEWNIDDITRIWRSQFEDGPRYKSIELPIADYSQIHRDVVSTPDGQFIGLSLFCKYTSNERRLVSYAILDRDHTEIGSEVEVTWGEPTPTAKNGVERHEQTTVRAIVREAPFSRTVREVKYQTTGAR